MTFDKFSLNGQIKPIADAQVSALNLEFTYGFGVYETLRVQGSPIFLNEHIERLLNSAKIIGLEHGYATVQIEEFVEKLIVELGTQIVYNLKIILIGGDKPLLYILPLTPRFPDRKLYRDGVSVMTVELERPFPQAKTLNMLPSYIAYKKARAAGHYEALCVDRNGNITEGTATNIFFVKGSTFFTPPKEKVLDGVTRQKILQIAQEHGIEIVEQDIKRSEIQSYSGAFLTSTSSKVMPIKKIDSYTYASIPEISSRLQNLYDGFIK